MGFLRLLITFSFLISFTVTFCLSAFGKRATSFLGELSLVRSVILHNFNKSSFLKSILSFEFWMIKGCTGFNELVHWEAEMRGVIFNAELNLHQMWCGGTQAKCHIFECCELFYINWKWWDETFQYVSTWPNYQDNVGVERQNCSPRDSKRLERNSFKVRG